MKYKSGAAFRRALEERLRQQSVGSGQSLTRFRKMVAFDRFLARLDKTEPEDWIVKGGFALQLRLGTRARTTKDIDISATRRWTREETMAHLREVASFAVGDWFEFEISEPAEAATGAPGQGFRFPIRCLLDSRQFENFHLDVGHGDPVLGAPDLLTVPDLLAFAEIAPAKVRCYPLTSQVAEKLHAYTRTYASGETSRARDLADILLAASLERFNSEKLRQAIEATYRARDTHAVPQKMPSPPDRISAPYRRLARELDFPWSTIEEAAQAAAQFLNPILKGNAQITWDPIAWHWD